MRIGVTGSTSGIGKRLLVKLSEEGFTPVPLGGSKSNTWRIGQEIPDHLNLDSLVHLAHDRSLTATENVKSATILCSSFKGPKLFLSSFSAHSRSISKYGQSKYAIENIINSSNGCSLRAGVVYGENVGGIFCQIEYLIRKSPLIPLPYSGNSLLFTTHIEDLLSEIVISLKSFDGKTKFAAYQVPISLEYLVLQVQEKIGTKKPLVKIMRNPLDSIFRVSNLMISNLSMLDSVLSLSREASYEEISKLKIPITNFRKFDLNIQS